MCSPCLAGFTFQDSPGQLLCNPVSSCANGEEQPPTSTSDRVCKPAASQGSAGILEGDNLYILIGVLAALLCCAFLCLCCCRSSRRRTNHQSKQRPLELMDVVTRQQSGRGSTAGFFKNEVIQSGDQRTAIFRSFRRSIRNSFRRPAWATRNSQKSNLSVELEDVS